MTQPLTAFAAEAERVMPAAEEVEENGFVFTVETDHAVVKEYTGTDAAVKIPAEGGGKPVLEAEQDGVVARERLLRAGAGEFALEREQLRAAGRVGAGLRGAAVGSRSGAAGTREGYGVHSSSSSSPRRTVIRSGAMETIL